MAMIVALDAMGGDHAPRIPVQGALEALKELGPDLEIILVGQEDELRRELDAAGSRDGSRLRLVHAPDVIAMTDKPAKAIREKPESSLLKAINLHKQGTAQAVVSAGHTGAQMAASYMILGLIEGVRRPTIGSLIPLGGGRFSILLDVGANTDCKPINLFQFAIMGSIFFEIMVGTPDPRIGLLSIGEEKTKGNDLVIAAHYLMEQSELRFIGNVEGGDIFSGRADVVVCDGFVGNVVLKFAESLGPTMLKRLKSVDSADPKFAQRVTELQRELDAAEIGGVPLLGVNGISIICHGNSSAKAIKNAIREAMTLSKGDLPKALTQGMEKYHASLLARGMARIRSIQDKRDEFEVEEGSED